MLTGIPGEFSHPTVTAALETVARAAKKTGKNWAATCGTVEAAKRYVDMGARLVFHGCDIVFVKNGLEQVRAEMTKQLGARFGGGAGASGSSYLEAK